VDEIEAAAFVSPRAVPQMRDAADVMAGVPRDRAIYAALVPNRSGTERALAAGAGQLVAVVSASEAHNRENLRRSVSESLADLDAIFTQAISRGVPVLGAVAVSFGCPYQGEVPVADVLRVAEAFLQRGAAGLTLADTAGMATPVRVQHLIGRVRERFPGTRLVLHFHNNRGTAMANLLAALDAGATDFDASLGGIGGCPFVPRAAGNLATEDVVYMLEEMGIRTGIDLAALVRAARRLEEILGATLPGQVMKSGLRRCGGADERTG
jgi:hydroxymethylglutaryl-CoA lyase